MAVMQRHDDPEVMENATVTSQLTAQGLTVLDVHECWALLREHEVGRLAVSITNHPDIFPINYVVDHGTIVFRTAEGTKLAASVLGVGVAFEIDGYDPEIGEAWSVVVKGWASEVQNMYELFEVGDLPLFPWNAAPKHRFVRIAPDLTSGRRFTVTDRAIWHREPRTGNEIGE